MATSPSPFDLVSAPVQATTTHSGASALPPLSSNANPIITPTWTVITKTTPTGSTLTSNSAETAQTGSRALLNGLTNIPTQVGNSAPAQLAGALAGDIAGSLGAGVGQVGKALAAPFQFAVFFAEYSTLIIVGIIVLVVLLLLKHPQTTKVLIQAARS